MNGWIKIHREIRDANFYSNPNALSLWIHLLVNASREKKELNHNNQIIQIMPGSFITTRRKLALETGIPESNIERTLNRWQIEQRVDQVSYGTFRLISIKNWNRYQDSEQEVNSKWTASEPQVTHYKEKENKKEEYINNSKELEASPRTYGNQEINKMLEALKAKIEISAFVDSAIERNIAKHCVNLLEKIGKDEFVRRLEILLSDSFHRKNCNKIKYVYNNIKGFIEPKITFSIFEL